MVFTSVFNGFQSFHMFHSNPESQSKANARRHEHTHSKPLLLHAFGVCVGPCAHMCVCACAFMCVNVCIDSVSACIFVFALLPLA